MPQRPALQGSLEMNQNMQHKSIEPTKIPSFTKTSFCRKVKCQKIFSAPPLSEKCWIRPCKYSSTISYEIGMGHFPAESPMSRFIVCCDGLLAF